jgi:hypothetical protein
MQTLTAKEVAKKALEFYECGKLTAQHPQQLGCVYVQSNGCRCAKFLARVRKVLAS